MTEVIDGYFSVLRSVWACIVGNWILSFAFLITLFGFVVNLYKSTRGDR